MRFILPAYLLIVTAVFITIDFPFFQENALQGGNGKNVYRHPVPYMIDLSVLNMENFPPEVRILLPAHDDVITWDDQLRYEISVSDPEDGESRYDEIEPNEVLLEVEYLHVEEEVIEEEKLKVSNEDQEPEGLFLIKTSGCFGCHRDKSSMVGPSFLDIAERYETGKKNIKELGNNIIEGSSGKWGSNVMPPHDQISQEEAIKIATFILEQGGNNFRWIYPGLEGVIRIMEKPAGEARGAFILTASYTDHGVNGDSLSRKRGSHSILIKIR